MLDQYWLISVKHLIHKFVVDKFFKCMEHESNQTSATVTTVEQLKKVMTDFYEIFHSTEL